MGLGGTQHLLHAQFKQSGHGQQHFGIRDQITDAQFQPVQLMRAIRSIGTHRCPQMSNVVHGAGINLGFGPGDEVLVIAEQRHAGWGQGELQPSLGMGACDLAVQER